MPSYYLKKENKEVFVLCTKICHEYSTVYIKHFLWQSSKYQNVVLSVFELTIFG